MKLVTQDDSHLEQTKLQFEVHQHSNLPDRNNGSEWRDHQGQPSLHTVQCAAVAQPKVTPVRGIDEGVAFGVILRKSSKGSAAPVQALVEYPARVDQANPAS